jgi:hypothetical protein
VRVEVLHDPRGGVTEPGGVHDRLGPRIGQIPKPVQRRRGDGAGVVVDVEGIGVPPGGQVRDELLGVARPVTGGDQADDEVGWIDEPGSAAGRRPVDRHSDWPDS